MEVLKKATESGVMIISVTQCISGTVSDAYATGKALLDIGIIPGNDLTPEAALTKLSYVLAKDDWDLEKKIKMMQTNIVGMCQKPSSIDIRIFLRSNSLSVLSDIP